MRKSLAISVSIIALMIYINCSPTIRYDKTSVYQLNNASNLDTLYINSTLLEYLNNYIEQYDTIQNTWKISPIYLIRFIREAKDTMVYISGHKVRPELTIVSEKKGLEIKGFFTINRDPIIIIDYKKSVGALFYKNEKLNTDIKSFDLDRKRVRFESKTLPVCVYKIIHMDSLLFIGKREGFELK